MLNEYYDIVAPVRTNSLDYNLCEYLAVLYHGHRVYVVYPKVKSKSSIKLTRYLTVRFVHSLSGGSNRCALAFLKYCCENNFGL